MKSQYGFLLVSAIFLLVILAALGAFILTISGTQQTSSALDVQGSRAYQAARAGTEWGTYQVLRNSTCNAGPTNVTGMGGTLSGFTAAVTCSSTATSEAGATVTLYQITSTGSKGTVGTLDRVERQLQVTLSQ